MRIVLLSLTLWLMGSGLVIAPAEAQSSRPPQEYRNPVVFQRFPMDDNKRPVMRGPKIWIMEFDGSGLYRMTDGPLYDDHPSLYSDLRHVLYSRYNTPGEDRSKGARLIKQNIYTNEVTVILEEPGFALHHAALTHDDRTIVYMRNWDTFQTQSVLVAGEKPYTLPTRALNGVAVGDAVIFMHEPLSGLRPRKVALVKITGRGAGARMDFLTDDRVLHRRPAVSPDGKMLAWQTNADGDGDEIFLADINGRDARNLTQAPGNDGHPWFSRDGQWIVFESDRSGFWEIWKMHIESRETVQLTDGKGQYRSTRPRM